MNNFNNNLDQRSIQRSRKLSEGNLEENQRLPTRSPIQERIEFLLFFIMGWGIWCFVAYQSLRYLKFPFHAHPSETILIFFGPLLAIGLLLLIIERTTRIKQD